MGQAAASIVSVIKHQSFQVTVQDVYSERTAMILTVHGLDLEDWIDKKYIKHK